jgi:hypothetical protein
MPLLSTPAVCAAKSQQIAELGLCQSFGELHVVRTRRDMPPVGWVLVHHALQSACMQQTNPMNDPALPAQALHDPAHMPQSIRRTYAMQRSLGRAAGEARQARGDD